MELFFNFFTNNIALIAQVGTKTAPADRPETGWGFGVDRWVVRQVGIFFQNKAFWQNRIGPGPHLAFPARPKRPFHPTWCQWPVSPRSEAQRIRMPIRARAIHQHKTKRPCCALEPIRGGNSFLGLENAAGFTSGETLTPKTWPVIQIYFQIKFRKETCITN
jgi:hypothetical protein